MSACTNLEELRRDDDLAQPTQGSHSLLLTHGLFFAKSCLSSFFSSFLSSRLFSPALLPLVLPTDMIQPDHLTPWAAQLPSLISTTLSTH